MSAPKDPHPTTAQVTNDHLTAGLVLVRALLAKEVPPEVAWPAIADFHAAIVRPLLDPSSALTDVEKADLLSWARANAGKEGLTEAAYSAPHPATVSEDMLVDLLELAERIGESSKTAVAPTGGEGPTILVEEPDGRCAVLTARSTTGGIWQTALTDTADAAVEAAVRDTLSQFSNMWRTEWSPKADRPLSVWWPPGVWFSAPATTLPVALWHLGRIAGFGAPTPLSIGEVINGCCVPVEGHALTARTRAAAALGRDMLVPTRTGWCLFAPDGKERRVGGPLTVDGAATAIWDGKWARWKRERHADELAALGWRVIDWHRTPEHQPIADLDTSQSWRLMRHFVNSKGPSVAVLGGTARSGKSATVRRLAATLSGRKRNPWLVQVLAGPTRELPDRHVAAAAGRHAFASLEHGVERRLLVLEDLHPVGNDKADEVLRYVSDQLGVPVLGVLRYGGSSPVEWRTEGVFVVTSVVGASAHQQFVTDLAKADPSLDAAAARAVLAGDHGEDLRRITQVMSAENDPGARLAARFTELAESERAPLVLAAALTLVDGELDAERLGQVEESDRDLFGVTAGSRPSSVRLMGLDDCFTLIDLHRDDRTPEQATSCLSRTHTRNEAIADLVEPELVGALETGSSYAADLLIGARLFHRAVCEKLLERAEGEGLLTGWISAAPVMSVVRVLGLTELLPEQMTQTMVGQLIRKLTPGSLDWHPAPLLALVRTLQDLEFAVPAQDRDEFVRWLVDVVDHLVSEQVGLPEERFALLVALERFNSEEVRALLTERLLDVLDGLRVDQVSSYRLVRQIEEMQRRLERRSPGT